MSDLDRRMRALESFHSLRARPDAWLVLRLDGKGFGRLSREDFDKPFDERLNQVMGATLKLLVTEMEAHLGYSQSDEISLLFPPKFKLFDRSLEKLVSISASLAGSAFTLSQTRPQRPTAFDSRVWLGESREEVVDYFDWRQRDAYRCSLSNWCYRILRKGGLSATQATRELHEKNSAWKRALLTAQGIDFKNSPAWYRRGMLATWQAVEKVGFNPKLQQEVRVTRRRLQVNRELPHGPEFRDFIRHLTNKTEVDSCGLSTSV